jgi:DNA-binding NtrC family response regulator
MSQIVSIAPVLLAGADARRRAILRAELAATLPRRTTFSEAQDIAEVLERAPRSRMVVLAGDLDDADAESLMRLLGARHPQLPVICVEEPMPAVAGGRG